MHSVPIKVAFCAMMERRPCPLWVRNRHPEDTCRFPLYPSKRTLIDGVEMSAWCHNRTHAAGAKSILSTVTLHRFVHEPLELDRKRVKKGHLTLRHDQACGIRLRRNPPLSACSSAPKEL